MFDVLLTLNSVPSGRINLIVNKAINLVLMREALYDFALMLVNAPHEIVRHANVNRSARPAGENIKKIVSHGRCVPKRDRRVKPGDDEGTE